VEGWLARVDARLRVTRSHQSELKAGDDDNRAPAPVSCAYQRRQALSAETASADASTNTASPFETEFAHPHRPPDPVVVLNPEFDNRPRVASVVHHERGRSRAA